MKNFIRVAAAAAIIMGFTACQKEGVFNPKKKISEIYSLSETLPSIFNMEKQLDEVWTWDNNLLKTIEYKNYYVMYDYELGTATITPWESSFAYFEYNGNQQLSQIEYVTPGVFEPSTKLFKYTYNKSKLDKIESWYNNENLETVKFEHKGAKITKLIWTEARNNIWWEEYEEKNSNASPLMKFIIPKVVCKQLSEHISKRTNSKSPTEIEWTIELTWKGNNVKNIVVYTADNPYIKMVTDYEYDKKRNPFYNDLTAIDDYQYSPELILSLSENNTTKVTAPYGSPITYEYKYEDNYPTEKIGISTDKYGYNPNSTHRQTTYYRYKP